MPQRGMQCARLAIFTVQLCLTHLLMGFSRKDGDHEVLGVVKEALHNGAAQPA